VLRLAGGGGPTGCGLARAAEGTGCVTEVHGLAIDTGGLVIATDGQQVIELSDSGGAVLRPWDPGLPGGQRAGLTSARTDRRHQAVQRHVRALSGFGWP
jgi:hypothetical protein